MIDTLINWDIQLFLQLNGIHSPFWDRVMWIISEKETWYPLYLFFTGIIIYRFRSRSWVILAVLILSIVFSDQGSVHLFKNVFERLRPCHNPDLEGLVHIVNNKCGGKFGFVSTHASNHFALAVFLIFLFKKQWFSITMLAWATIIAYSRIYLGVHYPFDIICGAAYGTIIGFLMFMLHSFILNKYFDQPKQKENVVN